MAKEKTKSRKDLFASLAKKTNGETLDSRDSISYFLDTGSLAVNFICSGQFIKGGVPGGKIIEMYGPSSSGKSLLASNILYGCQKSGGVACLLDCENASNAEFMERVSRLNTSEILRYTPMSLEQAFLKIHATTKEIRDVFGPDCPIVFVYDSISVSPCERELKETNLPEGYSAADWKRIVGRKEQPGERAKVCAAELRKLQTMLQDQNVTVVIINQTREKIGVLYGNPETTGGGGNSLPFYASLRLRTATRKKIENKKTSSFAGVNMHIKNIKNRSFRPFVETEGVQLFFDNGINPLTGLLSILINAGRIEQSGKGTYSIKAEFIGDAKPEYKFKGSMEKNTVALQVLLDNPKLIDAVDAQEVLDYVAPYKEAMASSESDEFNEKELGFDADGNPLDQDEETSEMED
jgi:recombination protein RecA